MIKLKDLSSGLTVISNPESSSVVGGGLPSVVGALTGAGAGALGQVGVNAALGRNLTTGVPEAIVINGITGAIFPPSGVAGFVKAAGTAAAGSFGTDTRPVNVPPVGNPAPINQPQSGIPNGINPTIGSSDLGGSLSNFA